MQVSIRKLLGYPELNIDILVRCVGCKKEVQNMLGASNSELGVEHEVE